MIFLNICIGIYYALGIKHKYIQTHELKQFNHL